MKDRKNKFNRAEQGLRHYKELKKSFDDENIEQLTRNLPLFIRIFFHDRPHWVKEMNRFDLCNRIYINKNYLEKRDYMNDIRVSTHLKFDKRADTSVITIEEFLDLIIIETVKFKYTVKEFLFGLAYNGILHMQPSGDSSEKNNYLYEVVLDKYEPLVELFLKQITEVILPLFDYYFQVLNPNYQKSFKSAALNLSPKLIIDSDRKTAICYFNNSYMELPIWAKKNKGIRIALEIKLKSFKIAENKHICMYKSTNNELTIKLIQNTMAFIYIVIIKGVTKSINLTGFGLDDFIKLEICLYPNGELVVAKNGIMNNHFHFNQRIDLLDGKFILGSNYQITKFSDFYLKQCILQTVEEFSYLRDIGDFALFKLRKTINCLPSKILVGRSIY